MKRLVVLASFLFLILLMASCNDVIIEKSTDTFDNTQEKESKENQPPEEPVEITVLAIGENEFPIVQFFISGADTGCDVDHWHAHGKVVSTDEKTTLSDPNPSGCGFGLVSQIPQKKTTLPSGHPFTALLKNAADGPQSNAKPAYSVTGTPGKCGLDITEALSAALGRVRTRVAGLPAERKGNIGGTSFLADNGINIDLKVSAIKDASSGNALCPTDSCKLPDGQSTVMLCGSCVMDHVPNDVLFGFTGSELGVSEAVLILGAHIHEIASYGGLDPLSSQAAYAVGRKTSESTGVTVGDICAAIDVPLKTTAGISSPSPREIMENEQSILKDCLRCDAAGASTPNVLKDFSTTTWT